MSNPTDPGAPEAALAGDGAGAGSDAAPPRPPSMASRIDALMDSLDDEEGDSDEHPGFQRHAQQALAESCGFSDVRFDTAYTVKKLRGNAPREYPVFLMVARKA